MKKATSSEYALKIFKYSTEYEMKMSPKCQPKYSNIVFHWKSNLETAYYITTYEENIVFYSENYLSHNIFSVPIFEN